MYQVLFYSETNGKFAANISKEEYEFLDDVALPYLGVAFFIVLDVDGALEVTGLEDANCARCARPKATLVLAPTQNNVKKTGVLFANSPIDARCGL